jgi:hypothetical protein
MATTGNVGWAALPPIITTRALRAFATFVDSAQELSTRCCPLSPSPCFLPPPRRAHQECPKALCKADVLACKYINLRTRRKRLVRRTICFSKTEWMPDLVIGLFLNCYAGGRLSEGRRFRLGEGWHST